MPDEAAVWTEGKTDVQHLKRAMEALQIGLKISFPQPNSDMGDDQLLKQCKAMSLTSQERVTIFMFDRDNPDIIPKVHDDTQGYKAWGNNVFSFAIPIPKHRDLHAAVCIEHYFNDQDLTKPDGNGRRIFLSNEFHTGSGRHIVDPRLSVGNKGKLASGKSTARILDSDVYNEKSENVALPKADFADKTASAEQPFDEMDFSSFRLIFDVLKAICLDNSQTTNLLFYGYESFLDTFETLEPHEQIASATETAIQLARLCTSMYCVAAIRRADEDAWKDGKRARPIRQTLTDHFTAPSLVTLIRLTKQCFHLPSNEDVPELLDMQAAFVAMPVLGPIGDLLDDLERAMPPDSRRGRIVAKRLLKKPMLDYVLTELAKYEGCGNEIAAAAADRLSDAEPTIWLEAVKELTDLLSTFSNVALRQGRVDRVEADNDQFVLSFAVYANKRRSTESIYREYTDISGSQLETYELQLTHSGSPEWYDMYPFLMIRGEVSYGYTRTRAIGYEYRAAFGKATQVIPTKRKFSQSAMGSATAFDSQNLFWAPVVAATSSAGVKGNIPAHDPTKFVGRRQQISEIMDEIISIPNQNGLVYGPGGVGKTTLLTAISRDIFERGLQRRRLLVT